MRIHAYILDNADGVIHANGEDGGDGDDAPNGYANCGAEHYDWGSGTIFDPYRDLAGGGGGGGAGGDGGNGGTVEVYYANLIGQGSITADGGSKGLGGDGGSAGGYCQYGVLIGGHQTGCAGGDGGNNGSNAGGAGGRGAHEGGDASEAGEPGYDGENGSPGTVAVAVHPAGYASNGYWESDVLDAGEIVDWADAQVTVADLPAGTNVSAQYAVYEQTGWVWYANIEDVPDSDQLMVKLTLETTDPEHTPAVAMVRIGYALELQTLSGVTSGSYVEYDCGTLNPNTTYRWQVAVSDGVFQTAGPVWEFTTGAGFPGDLDGDGDVDLADLQALLSAYGSCPGDANYNSAADLTDDGNACIGLADLQIVLAYYGTVR